MSTTTHRCLIYTRAAYNSHSSKIGRQNLIKWRASMPRAALTSSSRCKRIANRLRETRLATVVKRRRMRSLQARRAGLCLSKHRTGVWSRTSWVITTSRMSRPPGASVSTIASYPTTSLIEINLASSLATLEVLTQVMKVSKQARLFSLTITVLKIISMQLVRAALLASRLYPRCARTNLRRWRASLNQHQDQARTPACTLTPVSKADRSCKSIRGWARVRLAGRKETQGPIMMSKQWARVRTRAARCLSCAGLARRWKAPIGVSNKGFLKLRNLKAPIVIVMTMLCLVQALTQVLYLSL